MSVLAGRPTGPRGVGRPRGGASDPVTGRATGSTVVHLDEGSPVEALNRLRTAVSAHLLDGGRTVVVDVSRLSRLSSGTVAALLWAKRHCRARGGTVVVRGATSDSLTTLTRSGLGDVFDIEPGPRAREVR
ncbi:STAS domain-containing protein [Thalassiella azotivora]